MEVIFLYGSKDLLILAILTITVALLRNCSHRFSDNFWNFLLSLFQETNKRNVIDWVIFSVSVLVTPTTVLFTFCLPTFQSFIFSNKSLQIILRGDFVTMKVNVYLIGNRTRRANFPVPGTLRKICSISLAYVTVCFNFHKKDSGTLLSRFLE